MSEMHGRFSRDEQPASGETDAELAASLAMARDLESMAARSAAPSTEGFADRVMAAIAREPVPQPAAASGRALREFRLGAFAAALGDAWRVAFGGGRPLAARTQAFALVLVTVVALGSLGGIATVGALGLLERPAPPPTQPVSPPPSLAPSPTGPLPSPSPSPSPTDSLDPSNPVDPGEGEAVSPSPTQTHDDHTDHPRTAEPDHTQEADHTQEPDHTAEPGHTEDH